MNRSGMAGPRPNPGSVRRRKGVSYARALTLAVLLAMGLGASAGVALSADLPGQWQARAPSATARQEVSYVEAGGKFYLAGGTTTGLHERYDPATDSWSRVADLPVSSKVDHIQGVEVGGKIYYVGGLSGWPGPHVSTVHVYDPATDTFAQGASMPEGRGRGAGGVAAYGGKIYYAGGMHDGKAVPWFDAYDPKADSWSRLPDMPRARDHFQGAVVGGRFYAIGGRNSGLPGWPTTPKVDLYDLTQGAAGAWGTPDTGLPTQRGGFATAVLGREILVMGGEGGGKAHNAVEAYDTTANSWRTLEPLPTARHGTQAVVCNGGAYLAAGGTLQGGGGPTNKHEAFFLGAPTACGAQTEPPGDTTKPSIDALKPKPNARLRDRTPTIGAIVRDAGGELGKEDIELYVDRKARAFSYSQATDRLSYASTRLAHGRHTVRVVAKDGADNQAARTWSFKVVKKRG